MKAAPLTNREEYARLNRRRVRFNKWIGLPLLAVCALTLVLVLGSIVIAEPMVLAGFALWLAMCYAIASTL